MAIYTGNNGRLYLARQSANALFTTSSGLFTRPLTADVAKNQRLQVISQTGGGRNAVVAANSGGTKGGSVAFRVIDGGSGYNAGDKLYFAKRVNGVLVRVTNDFSVIGGRIQKIGIDNERDLVKNDNFLYGKIQSWQLSSSSEVTDTTALGDVTRSYRPSITSGEGSATLMFYEDDIEPTSGQKDVYGLTEVLFPRGLAPAVIISLAVDAGFDGAADAELFKSNFVFNAFITGATVSVAYGEVVTIETTFTVDGPLLEVPLKENVSRI